GADVEHGAALLPEKRKGSARHVERAFEIDVHHRAEPVRREILSETHEVSGGAVHEDVEPAEGVNGLRNNRVDISRLADIAGHAHGTHAFLANIVDRRQQMLFAAARDRHVATGASERKRNAAADAGAAARDERRTTFQQRLAEDAHLTGSASSVSRGSANGNPSVNSRDCSMRGTRSITSGATISSTTVAAFGSRNFRAFTIPWPSSDPTALLYASRLDFNRDPRSSK